MLSGITLLPGKASIVADAVAATGVDRVKPFCISAPPGIHKVNCQQVGATVLTGNVEFSLDGGTTWQPLVAFDFTTSATVKSVRFEVDTGILYRFNVGAITTTPATIYATLN